MSPEMFEYPKEELSQRKVIHEKAPNVARTYYYPFTKIVQLRWRVIVSPFPYSLFVPPC